MYIQKIWRKYALVIMNLRRRVDASKMIASRASMACEQVFININITAPKAMLQQANESIRVKYMIYIRWCKTKQSKTNIKKDSGIMVIYPLIGIFFFQILTSYQVNVTFYCSKCEQS